jgi:hypothetical protein
MDVRKVPQQFSHLAWSAYRILEAPIELRIALVDTLHYVEYPRAEEIINALLWRMSLPAGPRRPCMSIGGESGMGKTHLIIELHRRLGIDFETGVNDRGERPIFYISGAGLAGRSNFIARMNANVGVYAKKPQDVEPACAILRRSAVKLVIVDEAHDLRRLKADFGLLLSDIKHIANEVKRPIVLLGDVGVLNITRDDRHLHSRFQNWELPRWKDPVALGTFVAGVLAFIPLRAASRITDEVTMKKVIDLTEGNTEKIVLGIRSAARKAIRQELNAINRKLLIISLEEPF